MRFVESIVTVLKYFEFANVFLIDSTASKFRACPFVPTALPSRLKEVTRRSGGASIEISLRRSSAVTAEVASARPAEIFLDSAIFPRSWATGSTILVASG